MKILNPEKYAEIMVDIETMSTASNAAIISIGAVVMMGEELKKDSFYREISLESSMETGGHVSASTIKWWMEQEEDARRIIYAPKPAFHINLALGDLATWIKAQLFGLVEEKKPRIWANGANFDPVILRNAYARSNIRCPWSYFSELCYRTIKNTNRDIEADPFVGTKHNALDDTKNQAWHLIKIAKANS